MFLKNPQAPKGHVILILSSFLLSVMVCWYLSTINGFAGFNYLSSSSSNLGSFHLPSTNSTSNSDSNNSRTAEEKDDVVEKNPTPSFPRQAGEIAKQKKGALKESPCFGKYIFIHNLPSKFNSDLLDKCNTPSNSTKDDFCVHLQNDGFGPLMFDNSTIEDDFQAGSWFATNQFSLELIFHTRIKRYKCLTNDSSLADAIFIPFYAAVEFGRNLAGQNTTVRDKIPIELMNYISSLKEWKVLNGRDHFFVAGRISWDFRRDGDGDSAWGNKLMYLPQSENITMLTIESTMKFKNEVGIPYPTYFHPSSPEEIRQWQNSNAQRDRKYLFAFAGASRPNSIRGVLINQCLAAPRDCMLINCKNTFDEKCHSPFNVLKLFRNSTFCLQPTGDSPTRRSTFDSILSGCIPVFFDLRSGPQQYIWHFPSNYTQYSVYIPEEDVKANKTDIQMVLSSIPAEQVEAMRLEVIKMIPRVIYANSRREFGKLQEDAFDISLQGMLNRVENTKRKYHSGEKFD